MTTKSPDRLSLQIRLMLVILGALLCLIGWYRWYA